MKSHEDNARAWNQAADFYRRSIPKTVDFLRGGGVSMCNVELPFLAELGTWCHRAIHLQCAGGEDTLSLLNLGAKEVIGVDISSEMISVAKQTSKELGANASWINSDVLQAPKELTGTADLVYTGRGAIIWIHDLKAWAATIARLLKPGGVLYVFEGHPVTYFFDQKASSLQLDPEFRGYFSRKVYTSNDWPPEYVGDLGLKPNEMSNKHEVAWPVSDIISVLLESGLKLERFVEHPDAYWPEFPAFPKEELGKIPNTYSLLMRKP